MPAKPQDTTTLRGREAEEQAARHLEARGVQVLARNFRVRGGEIDLIGREGETLVFVEVRLRTRADFGGAAASIGRLKQARIVLAARHYLADRPDRPCRFDCVLIADRDGQRIEWIRDAFRVDD